MTQSFTVVWDGTPSRPMGRYLYTAPERPRRRAVRTSPRTLTPRDVEAILLARAVFDAPHVARAFAVDVETVEFLAAAASAGVLVRQGAVA